MGESFTLLLPLKLDRSYVFVGLALVMLNKDANILLDPDC